VLFFVASMWTILGQHDFFKGKTKADNEALEKKLALVSAKLSTQVESTADKRATVIQSFSFYDRNALYNSLNLIEDEMLDEAKSKYKRVRFSLLRSKENDAAAKVDAKVSPAPEAWVLADKQ